MSIFRIDMLPGREGDCLWIEYGDPARPRRILIDGGRKIAWDTLKARFAALPADQRRFELLILSHVDADHIEGLLDLVEAPDLPVSFGDVWFNGFDHLEKPKGVEFLGAKQGEKFSKGIAARRWPWNAAFDGRSVVIPDGGAPPARTLADGLRLTLLSPTWDKLTALRPVWEKELEKAGLVPHRIDPDRDTPGVESLGGLGVEDVEIAAMSRFKPDKSEANGSSIGVLAEFDGRRAVLSGDAHAEVMAASLRRLRQGGAPVALDAFKLSHHGSHGTHSVELMQEMRARRFLVSTDGSRHQHPHVEAVARTLKHGGGGIELVFNYSSAQTASWDLPALKAAFGYTTRFPAAGSAGLIRTEL